MNADEFLKSRGLSRQTLGKMNVGVVTKGGRDFLEFRHCRDGVVIGRKFRPTDEKTFRWAEDSEYRLWNVDQWVGPRLIITEGELDALALVEAGVSPGEVVSVPNGAKQQESADVRQAYPYIYDDLPALMKAEKIVLWTDNDVSGRCLRNDLVRVFGKAKTYHVQTSHKDAGEALRAAEYDLLDAISSAVLCPVDGLRTLSEVPEPPPREIWHPGFAEWESKVGIGRGLVSVVTGYPGHGKSVLWMQIWTQIAQKYGIKVCMASFETRAKPDHRRNIRSFIHHKLERDMTDDEKAEADAFNEGHFFWAEHPLARADPRWLFDIWEVSVVRHGCAAVQLDPYNRLEHSRPDRMSETDYIGNFLSECGDFARDLNCHVQIIAHPSKLQQNRDRRAPWLSDISGSAHWDNRVDAGYVIHRPEMYKDGAPVTKCQFICRKARYPELGYPCNLDMDFRDGYYRSVDYDEVSL